MVAGVADRRHFLAAEGAVINKTAVEISEAELKGLGKP